MFFWPFTIHELTRTRTMIPRRVATHTKREAVQRPGDLFQTRHNGDLNPDYGP